VARFTARLNDRLEALVRGHPEQWLWMHRRWKIRPLKRRLEMATRARATRTGEGRWTSSPDPFPARGEGEDYRTPAWMR
jgi:hypothetical protein